MDSSLRRTAPGAGRQQPTRVSSLSRRRPGDKVMSLAIARPWNTWRSEATIAPPTPSLSSRSGYLPSPIISGATGCRCSSPVRPGLWSPYGSAATGTASATGASSAARLWPKRAALRSAPPTNYLDLPLVDWFVTGRRPRYSRTRDGAKRPDWTHYDVRSTSRFHPAHQAALAASPPRWPLPARPPTPSLAPLKSPSAPRPP